MPLLTQLTAYYAYHTCHAKAGPAGPPMRQVSLPTVPLVLSYTYLFVPPSQRSILFIMLRVWELVRGTLRARATCLKM